MSGSHTDLVSQQLRATVRAANPETGADGVTLAGGSADADARALREDGTLAAWTGLTTDADAVERMLAAQMVATHDLAMTALGRAVARADNGRYFGASIRDATQVMTTSLRQIETLARYRTWRRRDTAADAAADAAAGALTLDTDTP